MDFGDILDKWEKSNPGKNPEGKKSGESPEVPRVRKTEDASSLKKADPITVWIRRHGVFDKDAAEEKNIPASERRRDLHRKKPDMTIDLHGLTRDEAWISLETFFSDARKRGMEKVLIIHGKGNHSPGESILKRTVREFIERCPFAGESGQGSVSQGASGSTWVILKGQRKNS